MSITIEVKDQAQANELLKHYLMNIGHSDKPEDDANTTDTLQNLWNSSSEDFKRKLTNKAKTKARLEYWGVNIAPYDNTDAADVYVELLSEQYCYNNKVDDVPDNELHRMKEEAYAYVMNIRQSIAKTKTP